MSNSCEEQQVRITGYLDGELDAAETRALEEHLKACPVCMRELDAMKTLIVGTAACLKIEHPPEEVWDAFLDDVYNRLERKTGWMILIVGLIASAAYGAVLFVLAPWADWPLKVLLGALFAGLTILFISVLRQRMRVAKTDRYTKEVKR